MFPFGFSGLRFPSFTVSAGEVVTMHLLVQRVFTDTGVSF